VRGSAIVVILAVAGLVTVFAAAGWCQDALTDSVPPYATYRQSLERAWRAGVLIGYPDGTFRPDDILTRAELCEGFNRLLDVVRSTQGIALEDDIDPTYARGVRDHWGFHAWERLLNLRLVDHRPMQLIRNMEGGVTRLECAELAVRTLGAYGVLQPGMTPIELAVGDIMVRQADGKVHFRALMPRWEFAVAMSRMLDAIAAAGG
jgi:hypothetical protein